MNSKTEYEHGKGHRKRRFCALAFSSVVLCVTPTLTMSWDLSSPVDALHPSAVAFPLDANELEVYSNRGSSISQAIAEVQSTNTDLSKRGITVNRIPEDFRLEVFPNPFRNTATINLTLNDDEYLRIVIVDPLGREVALVAEGLHNRGLHTFRYEDHIRVTGLFFIRASSSESVHTVPLVLIR